MLNFFKFNINKYIFVVIASLFLLLSSSMLLNAEEVPKTVKLPTLPSLTQVASSDINQNITKKVQPKQLEDISNSSEIKKNNYLKIGLIIFTVIVVIFIFLVILGIIINKNNSDNNEEDDVDLKEPKNISEAVSSFVKHKFNRIF